MKICRLLSGQEFCLKSVHYMIGEDFLFFFLLSFLSSCLFRDVVIMALHKLLFDICKFLIAMGKLVRWIHVAFSLVFNLEWFFTQAGYSPMVNGGRNVFLPFLSEQCRMKNTLIQNLNIVSYSVFHFSSFQFRMVFHLSWLFSQRPMVEGGRNDLPFLSALVQNEHRRIQNLNIVCYFIFYNDNHYAIHEKYSPVKFIKEQMWRGMIANVLKRHKAQQQLTLSAIKRFLYLNLWSPDRHVEKSEYVILAQLN